MVSKERYYKWAGYVSLPCVLLSLIITLGLGSYWYGATLIPACFGLVLAISRSPMEGSMGCEVLFLRRSLSFSF
jgi:hypothetical protein